MSFPIKIRNYRFSKKLGNGTFGKVKRKCILKPNPFSRLQRSNKPQSGDQNSEQKAHQAAGCLWKSQTRDQSAPTFQPPTHHQALWVRRHFVGHLYRARIRCRWWAIWFDLQEGKSKCTKHTELVTLVGWTGSKTYFPVDHLGDRVLSPPQNDPSRPQAGEFVVRRGQQYQADWLWSCKLYAGRHVPQHCVWVSQLCRSRSHLGAELRWLRSRCVVLWGHSLRYGLRLVTVRRRPFGSVVLEDQRGQIFLAELHLSGRAWSN